MTDQMSNLNDLLKYIENNNKFSIELPYSKKTVELERYSIDSLTTINDIFDKENNSEIVIEYLKYLFEVIIKRLPEDIHYIDFLFSIFSLREKENPKYKDINLTDLLNEIKIKKFETENKTLDITDGPIVYSITTELPTLHRLKKIISAAKTETKDIIFYNTFKYIKNVNIKIEDKRSSVSSPEDLYQLYNVLSYKTINQLSSFISTISNNISNVFQIDIETDTGFLYNI